MSAASRVRRHRARAVLLVASLVATAATAAFATAPPASAAIVATTTTLSLSSTSVQLNQPVTMTATVTSALGGGSPTGSVVFQFVSTDGTTTTAGTAPLVASGSSSSQATLVTSSISGSTYQVMAAYSGAFLAFAASKSAPISLTVAGVVRHPTATRLSADTTDVRAGDDATFTVNVSETDGSAVPTGVVSLVAISDGFQELLGQATLDGSGNAQLTFGGWQVGGYTVVARYLGDGTNQTSSDQLVLSSHLGAGQLPTTTNLALDTPTIISNATVHLTATVVQSSLGKTPPVGDDVNFYATTASSSQAVYLGTSKVTWTADGVKPASGVATLAMSGWRAGSYTISARFAGDTYDAPSMGSAALAVTAPAVAKAPPPTTKTTATATKVKPKPKAKPKPKRKPRHPRRR